MTKASLIVLGIIFITMTIIITQIIFTPAEKSDIRTANSLCSAEVNAWGIKVPLGSLGQKILGKEEDCKNIHYMMLLIDYSWIGYAIGGLFLILGIIISGGRKEYHEERHSSKHTSKHCGECGAKLKGHEKHCPECGEKI